MNTFIASGTALVTNLFTSLAIIMGKAKKVRSLSRRKKAGKPRCAMPVSDAPADDGASRSTASTVTSEGQTGIPDEQNPGSSRAAMSESAASLDGGSADNGSCGRPGRCGTGNCDRPRLSPREDEPARRGRDAASGQNGRGQRQPAADSVQRSVKSAAENPSPGLTRRDARRSADDHLAGTITELQDKLDDVRSHHHKRMMAKDHVIRSSKQKGAHLESVVSQLRQVVAKLTAEKEGLANDLADEKASTVRLNAVIDDLREQIKEQHEYNLYVMKNASRIFSLPDPSLSVHHYTSRPSPTLPPEPQPTMHPDALAAAPETGTPPETGAATERPASAATHDAETPPDTENNPTNQQTMPSPTAAPSTTTAGPDHQPKLRGRRRTTHEQPGKKVRHFF